MAWVAVENILSVPRRIGRRHAALLDVVSGISGLTLAVDWQKRSVAGDAAQTDDALSIGAKRWNIPTIVSKPMHLAAEFPAQPSPAPRVALPSQPS